MILPRRDFLKLLGVAAGSAGLGGCAARWAVPDDRVEMALRGPGLESEVQTVCGMCESGCGMTVRLVDGLPVGLKGNPHHPLNHGGLCPVGNAGLEVLYAPDRLQSPMRGGADGELVPTTWDEALDTIGGRLGELRARGEGNRIALLHDEPGSLFDDLAGRFVQAVGSASVARPEDPAALAYRLTQGIDESPGFDLGGADLVLSFGLDLYEDGPAPLHAVAHMVATRPDEERAATIHVGTRLSPSAAKAEEWVSVQPGTHAAFALGVAHVLVREGHYDNDFVDRHTFGFDDWTDDRGQQHVGFRRLLLERYYPDRAARFCGADAAAIIRVARRLAEASWPVAVAGGEATRGTTTTWTVMAVQALNALMGAFDRRGGVILPPPIPLTPLDDAGTEAPPAGDSVFARTEQPSLGGADPVQALADGVLDGSTPVEVLLVASANPVHDSPAGERLREAMERIPMVVALAPFVDETSRHADYVLPTPVFLERWQGTTTPATVAFSTVGVAPPVLEPLHDTRHPGDVLLELARGADSESASMPWDSYAGYLQQRLEGLARSSQGAIVTGSFEETWVHFLEERGWRFAERRQVDDHWDELLRQAGWWNPVQPRGDWERIFRTPSGRYEFWASDLERRLVELGGGGEADARGGTDGGAGNDGSDAETRRDEALRRSIEALGLEAGPDVVCLPHFEPPRTTGAGETLLQPFRPLTARGSLGAASPMLLEMFGHSVFSGWQTWAEIAPGTAAELGVGNGDLVTLESERGSVEAVIRVHPAVVAGVVHVPLGLGHTEPVGAGGGIGSNPLRIVLPERDSLGGSLSIGSTLVEVRLLRRSPHAGAGLPHEGAGGLPHGEVGE